MRRIAFAEVVAFYAEVERSADPALASRPVIVGGDPRKRGQVQSATPDAIAQGVTEGMPMLEALERCPSARALRTDMKRYREVASGLRACLRAEVDALEPMGLGGAFLDLAGAEIEARSVAGASGAGVDDPERVAEALQKRVREELSLPLQVGIASAKFLARLAAEEAGPAGICWVREGSEATFLAPLDVGRLPGVGPKTVQVLEALGARRVADLRVLPAEALEHELGNHGLRILEFARGEDAAPVRAARHPQSVSQEFTFDEPQLDLGSLWSQLLELAHGLEPRLRRENLGARRIALKVRYADQEAVTRSRTVSRPVAGAGEIQGVAIALLDRTHAGSRPVKQLGLSLSSLTSESISDPQLELFPTRR